MGVGMVYMGDHEGDANAAYEEHVKRSQFDSRSPGYGRTVWMADKMAIVRQHNGWKDWEKN